MTNKRSLELGAIDFDKVYGVGRLFLNDVSLELTVPAGRGVGVE